jgi:hypothetical protein
VVTNYPERERERESGKRTLGTLNYLKVEYDHGVDLKTSFPAQHDAFDRAQVQAILELAPMLVWR